MIYLEARDDIYFENLSRMSRVFPGYLDTVQTPGIVFVGPSRFGHFITQEEGLTSVALDPKTCWTGTVKPGLYSVCRVSPTAAGPC